MAQTSEGSSAPELAGRGLADPVLLVGTWRLERVVDDRITGTLSRIHGRLLLTEVAPGRLGWSERGWWQQPSGDVEVHRSLRVELTSAGWWVRFLDGRDFHPWAPGKRVVHDCRPDTYTGVVSGTPDRWTVHWQVAGPRKDYDMTTVLSPEG